jgi:hypothetical protein
MVLQRIIHKYRRCFWITLGMTQPQFSSCHCTSNFNLFTFIIHHSSVNPPMNGIPIIPWHHPELHDGDEALFVLLDLQTVTFQSQLAKRGRIQIFGFFRGTTRNLHLKQCLKCLAVITHSNNIQFPGCLHTRNSTPCNRLYLNYRHLIRYITLIWTYNFFITGRIATLETYNRHGDSRWGLVKSTGPFPRSN